MYRYLFYLICILLLISSSGVCQTEKYQPIKEQVKVPKQPWLRYHTYDSLNRKIDFYLSETKPSNNPLPLVIYIHGSGANSHFQKNGDKIYGTNGHSTINDVFGKHARVLIVEKPGIDYLTYVNDSGIAASQYSNFRKEHSLERWCEAIHAATKAAISLEEILNDQILIIGHSEGGLVAAKLAAYLDEITHVAILAGEGPTQLYSIIELAKKNVFFSHISDNPEERVEYILSSWKKILNESDNYNNLFFGHSYLRWSSFLSTSSIEQLSNTNAKIYIAQGDNDSAVYPETAKILYTHLLSKNKDVQLNFVKGADHNFAFTDQDINGWKDLHENILKWFLE